MNKNTYYGWANNDQGANTHVVDAYKKNFTSINAAVRAARNTMGSGWTIHIMRTETDGPDTEIKTFRIR